MRCGMQAIVLLVSSQIAALYKSIVSWEEKQFQSDIWR